VAALTAERDLAVGQRVEPRAQVDQVVYGVRAFGDEDTDRLRGTRSLQSL